MKLEKKNLHMLKTKSQGENQLTFDEDFNVSDNKPDIRRMIQKKGTIHIEEIQVSEGIAHIQGMLHFQLLYVADTPGGQIASLEGKLPISESLHLEGLESGDKVCVKWEIEDLTLYVINSRKLNLKAVVEFQAWVDEIEDFPLPLALENQPEVSVRERQIQAVALEVHKKDTLRKKEEITLSGNKPDVKEILWSQVQVKGIETRAGEGELSVKGEISAFVLYTGEDDMEPVEWMEESIPFSGTVPCAGCTMDMVPEIETTMIQGSIEAKPDADGEERILGIDVVLELDMKVYQEQTETILTDVYSPVKECIPVRKTETMEQLIIKNDSKCRVSHKVSVEGANGKILQICHSDGEVKVDSVEKKEQGIQVQGVLIAHILYCISDDEMPFYSMETVVPFTHMIQAEGMGEDCVYRLRAQMDQLSTIMLDSNEIEIKGVIDLNALVLRQWKEELITDIEERELDREKMEKMPGIICYIVQPQDTLWDIAKRFYTTVESVKEMNHLEDETLQIQQPLLIVKNAEG